MGAPAPSQRSKVVGGWGVHKGCQGGAGGQSTVGSGRGKLERESLVFNPIISHRGLQRLGGGARREWLGRGKEPHNDAGRSFPDLLRDFVRVSGL